MYDTPWPYTGEITYSPRHSGGNWYGQIFKNGHHYTSIRSYTKWTVFCMMKWAVFLDKLHTRRAEKKQNKNTGRFEL